MSNVFRITDGGRVGGAGGTSTPLQSGDGGGTSDGMEARVKLLEYQAAQTEKVLGRIESKIDRQGADIAEMKGRINAMPSSWQMTGLVFATMALLIGALSVSVVLYRMMFPA
jgi:hypothetical protein